MRFFGPSWLKTRMKEVGIKNATGIPENFGSDKNWPVEKKEGKFVQFTPQTQFFVQHYEYENIAHIDQWGGRQTENLRDPVSSEFVPFLGDSFTFGVGVEDREVFVNLLKKRLGYQFLNLGVPGSCIVNHEDIISFRHQQLGEPSVYIFSFFIGNDLTNLFEYSPDKDNHAQATRLKPLRGEKSTQILEMVNDFVRQNKFLRKVYFIQFIKSKLLILYNRYLASQGIIRRMDDEIFHVIQDDKYFSEMLKFLDVQLENLVQLSQDLHFQPVFVLIPDKHQIDAHLLNDKIKYYGLELDQVKIELLNETLGKKLDNLRIPSIDILGCLRRFYQEAGNPKLYYVLDNHLTAEGHEAVAQCLEDPLNQILSNIHLN